MSPPRLLEVCVDDARGLEAAIAGGADRIELCSALGIGGLTPSPGLMALAAQSPVPVYAMVRPRAGGFVYDDSDIRQMERDIDAIVQHGLQGIVIGVSREDGTLDAPVLARLIERAKLPATLHRAIDLTPDLLEAVQAAIDLGFERILTSGGEKTALEGVDMLERMIEAADGRIGILPGSGITVSTVGPLLERLHLREIHASCSSPFAETTAKAVALGFTPAVSKRTDEALVRALKARINA